MVAQEAISAEHVEYAGIDTKGMPYADSVPLFFPADQIDSRFIQPKPIRGTDFSTIYSAYDTTTGELAAVKFFREPTYQRRLWATREIGLHALQLNGTDGVLPVLHSGAVERGSVTYRYLATRYCKDGTLPIDEPRTQEAIYDRVRIVKEAIGAAAVLHEQGFVHRDIKPENIYIGPKREGWLGDMGIATHPCRQGGVVGTPGYIPIEAMTQGIIDHRFDIYGAGAALYETLTGLVPYKKPQTLTPPTVDLYAKRTAAAVQSDNETLSAIADAMACGDLIPPHKLNPAVEASLSKVVMTALEYEPTDRYSEIGQLQEDLESAISPRVAVAI